MASSAQNNISAIVADMDGTLFDTERLYQNCWFELAKKRGFYFDEEMLCKMRGHTPDEAKLIFEKRNEKFDFFEERIKRTQLINEYIEKYGVPIKNGCIDFLNYCKKKSLKLALGSSSSSDVVNKYLELADMKSVFDVCICGDMVSRGKPAPDIFLRCSKEIGISPNNILVLEDSPNGVLAAKAAGMRVFAIQDLSDLNDVEDLIEGKADSFYEVIEWLNNIL